ncbi:MAG: DUF3987 domain-containing protein [Chloroflexi bacterium]|nr:DUF3987 domain-containing protein [Chloroflexota bacterium]
MLPPLFGAEPDGRHRFQPRVGGKLVGAVARITGILHLADYATHREPWAVAVPAATVSHAITIGRYLTAHAKAAFAEMGTDPEVEDAQHIVRWLQQRAGQATITKRDLYQGTKGRFKKVTALDGPLSLLLEHGYLREIEQEDRPGPGRKPSTTYEINPALTPSHNSHNSHNASGGD